MSSLRCAVRGSGLLHVAFNQDNTCLVVTDMNGLSVFSIEQHKRAFRLDIGAISLLAYVGAGEQPTLSPRKLTLFNTHANVPIQSVPFPSTILAVHMNRKRQERWRRTLLYALETLELLRTVDTVANPEGVCALTLNYEPACLLASPDSENPGTIRVYDAASSAGTVFGEFAAHNSPLAVLAWNDNGSLLASASQKGTVIRPSTAAQAASAMLSSIVPAPLARAVEPARCLTTIRLPGRPSPGICALLPAEADRADDEGSSSAGSRDWLTLLAATAEGILYSFKLEATPEGSYKSFLQGEWFL
ncbi:hypothetical protein QBZ16_001286 [Prototheca wickerhamii]|uniref:Uncharacterized protein n=1 Tax=Prototheca wickerhamii TaxID=3111 RepID=A0AAD9IFZ8_PROWI|nr:hypothetical protein QBZ16_001286 [Prototheca wickerhamii]